MLIDAKAAVDAADSNGDTALMWACMNGHEACARLLIDAKAAVDATRAPPSSNGFTALMKACQWSRGMRAFAHRRGGGGGCGEMQHVLR